MTDRNDGPRLIDAPFIKVPSKGGVEQVAVRALLSNLWDAGRETHAVTWSAPFPSRVRHTEEKTMATLLSQLCWARTDAGRTLWPAGWWR